MPAIRADRFWDLYFRGGFLTLARDRGIYVGTAYSRPELAQPPGGILQDLVVEEIEIVHDVLRQHDYERDERFSRIALCRRDIGEAYEAVVRQTYPYREAAPFGKSRMAELFDQLRAQLGHREHPISLARIEETVLRLVEHHSEAQNQSLAALAWFLGERRERSSAEALTAIVSNAPFVPFAAHQIHFTAIDAAMSALWKVNDKRCLAELVELMSLTDEIGKRKLAPLFERLLSTTELLSLKRCDDDYFRSEFWRKRLEPRMASSLADWDRFDSDSLFWEIRYLAALRLPGNDTDSLHTLAGDVVQTVALAARARLED